MLLVPPQIDDDATEKLQPKEMKIEPSNDIVEAREKVKVLAVLDREVKGFTKRLGKMVDRLEDMKIVTPAILLASLLSATGSMLDGLEGWAQNAQGGEDGYEGGSVQTGAGNRKNRKRAGASGDAVAGKQSSDGTTVKRGRGRPKGSKNKPKPDAIKPGDFKQQLRASLAAGKPKRKSITERVRAATAKRAAKRLAPKRTAVKAKPKTAAARKGGQRGGGKPAKKATRKR
jgi:hypothetical protein